MYVATFLSKVASYLASFVWLVLCSWKECVVALCCDDVYKMFAFPLHFQEEDASKKEVWEESLSIEME